MADTATIWLGVVTILVMALGMGAPMWISAYCGLQEKKRNERKDKEDKQMAESQGASIVSLKEKNAAKDARIIQLEGMIGVAA